MSSPTATSIGSRAKNPMHGSMYTTISFEMGNDGGVEEGEDDVGFDMPERQPPRLSVPSVASSSIKGVIRNSQSLYDSRPRLCTFLASGLPFIIVIIVLACRPQMSCPSTLDIQSLEEQQRQIYSDVSSAGDGMVVSDNPVCSQVGADVLRDGGLAIDAAIATAFCLGVVSPASSGIGGGAFILNYDYEAREAIFIDSRETAPGGADENMFVSDPLLAQNGGLAIATLAEVKGLELAFRTFGSGSGRHSEGVSWERLVSPAAELAENWQLDEVVAHYVQKEIALLNSGKFPEWSSLYLDADGNAKQSGDWIQQPKLAETLRGIAQYGSSYIYDFKAVEIAADIQAAGGIVTAEDIKGYDAKIRTPVRTSLMGYDYIGAPPPSSGGSTISTILSFISGYARPVVRQGEVYYHRLVESMKHAFALRMSLGDPEFMSNASWEAFAAMTNGSYISLLREATHDDACLSDITQYGGKYSGLVLYDPDERYSVRTADAMARGEAKETGERGSKPNLGETVGKLWAMPIDHGTTHMSVLDRFGNAVGITSTVNTYFGSKVISPSTGILFNNEMDDFSIPNSTNYFGLHPSESNYVKPYKRPLSSMSPSILLDKRTGRVMLVGGASGGPHIITATAQVLLKYISEGVDLTSSIFSSRVHSQLLPDLAYIENRTITWSEPGSMDFKGSQEQRQALASRGHQISALEQTDFGCSQFIAVNSDSGEVFGAADPRKNGQAVGL